MKHHALAAVVLVVSSAASARAADTDQFRVALIPASGLASVVAEADLTPQLAAAADHAWIWSATRSPVHADGAQLRSGAWKKAFLDSRDDARVSVRLAEPKVLRQRRSYERVIAAPVELWSRIAEADLPAYSVDDQGRAVIPATRGERLRLRYSDSMTAAWWLDVRAPGSATLQLAPATTLNMSVLDEQKNQIRGATAALVPSGIGVRAVAQLRTDAKGMLQLRIPGSSALTVITTAAEFAPASFTASAEDFPATIQLRRGRTLLGRIVTPKGAPVGGAAVRAEAWIGDSFALYSRTTLSDADGRWTLASVPRGSAKVIVAAAGHASVSEAIENAGDTDVGPIELPDAATVRLKVVSAIDGRPVTAVTAELLDGGDHAYDGDARGELAIEGVPAASAARVRLRARGFLDRTETIDGGERRRIVELTPGVTVKGTLVDESGLPLGAAMTVESGNRFVPDTVGDDGKFELLLEPDREYDLRFEPAAAAETTVHLAAERAGAIRDLGEIRPQRGVVARGIVRDELGQPLAGARLWFPRTGTGGPIVSWVNGRVISTTTDADGRFALKGLPLAAALVRVDHPQKARGYVTLDPQQADEVLEVPPIVLTGGATIRVLAGRNRDDLSVSLDLRGAWEETDWLTAAVRDGVATLRHVPAGPAVLHVRAGGRVICQRDVDIGRDADLDADCAAEQVEVSGVVTFGGVPAADGQLVWSSSVAAQPAAGIFTTSSPGGVQQQRVFGAGAPRVSVSLSESGTYRTRELFPGRWTVTWLSPAGISTEPRVVDIPSAKTFDFPMQFAGGRLSGSVIDGDGKPIARAHVRETGSGASTLTAADGTFELRGVRPGLNRLQAQAGSGLSRVVAVEIEERREANPVTLTVAGDSDGALRVVVSGPGGQPVAGAFVFMESDQLLTAMTSGAGVAEFARPEHVARFRVAAYAEGRWAFGDWQSSDDRGPVRLAIGESGRLRITSERGGLVAVTGPNGWLLSLLMSRVGLLPRIAGGELLMSGLPPGAYSVSLPPNAATVVVARNEAALLEIR